MLEVVIRQAARDADGDETRAWAQVNAWLNTLPSADAIPEMLAELSTRKILFSRASLEALRDMGALANQPGILERLDPLENPTAHDEWMKLVFEVIADALNNWIRRECAWFREQKAMEQ